MKAMDNSTLRYAKVRPSASFVAVACMYGAILLLSGVSYFSFHEFQLNSVVFRYDRWISLLSLVYFFGLMVFSFGSIRRYCFVTPLVILTVPNAVNSYFPAIYLGPLTDMTNATFPFVTHIDVFLIYGLANLTLSKTDSLSWYHERIDVFVVAMTAFYLLAVFATFFISGDITRYLNNAFHIRYLALFYLLHKVFITRPNREIFLKGIIIAMPIVLIESSVTSLLNDYSFYGSFSSGNFANNVLGHLLAFVTILLIFGRNREYSSTFFSDLVVFSVFIGMLLTGVRGAYLSFVLCLLCTYVLTRLSFRNVIVFFVIFLAIVVFTISRFIDIDYWDDFIYAVTYIFQNGFDAYAIKIDPTTTSIFTRVTLWIATTKMYFDNLLFGVGFAEWNMIKAEYGVPFRMLLDPHNDYLFYLVSYGSVLGLGFLWFIYLKPIIHFIKKASNSFVVNPYYYALFGFCFSGLTNANTSKHQVFALVLMIAFFAVFREKEQLTT